SNARFKYGLNVTGVVARTNEFGATHPLTVAPRYFGNARIAYDLRSHPDTAWPTLAIAGHYMSARPADRAFDSGFSPTVYAPEQLELRGTISGDVPLIKGLSYRVMANWAKSNVAPYFEGPTQSRSHLFGTTNVSDTVTLLPVDTFRVSAGLQWDLLP